MYLHIFNQYYSSLFLKTYDHKEPSMWNRSRSVVNKTMQNLWYDSFSVVASSFRMLRKKSLFFSVRMLCLANGINLHSLLPLLFISKIHVVTLSLLLQPKLSIKYYWIKIGRDFQISMIVLNSNDRLHDRRQKNLWGDKKY